MHSSIYGGRFTNDTALMSRPKSEGAARLQELLIFNREPVTRGRNSWCCGWRSVAFC